MRRAQCKNSHCGRTGAAKKAGKNCRSAPRCIACRRSRRSRFRPRSNRAHATWRAVYQGDVEIWKLINLSPDTHPIHIHLVQFKLVGRYAYSPVQRRPDPSGAGRGGYEIHADPSRDAIKIDPAEAGWKDTIRVDPAQMAIVAVPFRAYAPADVVPEQGARLYITGRYMYHCHILEHEDHEMMRPYIVMPPEVIDHMDA
ncbi:MAG: multicopper oxidase domain-containing protein [Vulcanimicrobiaceae bacterium]